LKVTYFGTTIPVLPARYTNESGASMNKKVLFWVILTTGTLASMILGVSCSCNGLLPTTTVTESITSTAISTVTVTSTLAPATATTTATTSVTRTFDITSTKIIDMTNYLTRTVDFTRIIDPSMIIPIGP